MNFSQPSDHPGISARLARFAAALLEHFLALSSLATWEAKQGVKQTLFCALLLFLALLLGLVGYLFLLAIIIIIATTSWKLSLLFTLSLLTLSHFLAVGILLLFLYRKCSISFFKLTRDELLHDIEALNQINHH
ncbi:MAG: hypothetical protein K2W97_04765 [Chthoniobacterales bacterium]|nr:hypothetical protein [Chthoniobacterales bacterium]